MLARLGLVIYLAGVGIAGLLALCAVISVLNGIKGTWIMLVILAVPIWLIGRASLFVLAGE